MINKTGFSEVIINIYSFIYSLAVQFEIYNDFDYLLISLDSDILLQISDLLLHY